MSQADQLARTHLAPDPADLFAPGRGHTLQPARHSGGPRIRRSHRHSGVPSHAVEVVALVGDDRFPMQHIESGLFAVVLPFTNLIDYRLRITYEDSDPYIVADAYRFLPSLGEVDLHLFAEGRHERLWEVLGAHPRSFTTADGVVNGVSFAVWAPNAKGVSLIAEFNGWNGNEAPMRVARLVGRVGVVLARFPARRPVQVPGARRRRLDHRPCRPDGVRYRGAAADRLTGERGATTAGVTTPG